MQKQSCNKTAQPSSSVKLSQSRNYAYPPVYNPNYYQQYPPPPNPNLYPNPQPIYPPNLAYNNPQDSW